MHNLEKRVRKLEGQSEGGHPHTVYWITGELFADSLKRCACSHVATGRRLVRICGSSDAPMKPEHAEEYAKAEAWARGEDWEALP